MRLTAVFLVFLAAPLGAEDLQTQVYRARDRALPALVNVRPVVDLFQGGRRRRAQVTGSGVIVRADGLVVTNFHVAGHARKVYCTLADKNRVEAKLLGGDPATDLAVLQLDMKEVRRIGAVFTVASLGSKRAVQVGEFVLALGAPRGLSTSLTTGVVSNLSRFLGDDITLPSGEPTGLYNTWIQTDAAINPGNSGGPLVNLLGEVIGINSRGVQGGDGLGFAIPAPVVRYVYEQIVANGRVKRSWVGIDRGLQPLSFDAPVRGVRLGHVVPGSPAAKAGLKPGDIVTTISGEKIDARFADDIPSIRRLVATSPVDEPLAFGVMRNGKTMAIQVRTRELTARKAQRFDARRFGCTVRDVTDRFARTNRLGDQRGVLVTGVMRGGPAAAAGIRSGDVILGFARTGIANLDGFRTQYEEAVEKKTESVLVNVWRNQRKLFRVVKPKLGALEEDDE